MLDNPLRIVYPVELTTAKFCPHVVMVADPASNSGGLRPVPVRVRVGVQKKELTRRKRSGRVGFTG